MIAQMSRIEIICLRDDMNAMVDLLQEEGTLHLEEVPLVVEGVPGFLHRVHLTESEKKETDLLQELLRSLDEIFPLLPTTPRHDDVVWAMKKVEKLSLVELADLVRKWSRELRLLTRRRLSLSENIEVLEAFLHALQWVAPLLRGRSVQLGKTARAVILNNVSKDTVEQLRRQCQERIGYDSDVLVRKVSRSMWAGIVVYPEHANSAVEKLLHDEGIVRLDMPEHKYPSGQIEQVMAQLDEELAQQRQALASVLRETGEFGASRGPAIAATRSLLQNRLARFNAMKLFAQSHLLVVIHGWIPTDMMQPMRELVEERFAGSAVLEERSLQGVSVSEVPTLLRNHRFFKPFEVLLSLFRPPAYGTLDPTPIVAIAFLLFYGFILGDVIYGLVVALASWAIRTRFPHLPPVASACTVGMYMGISGMVFGILFGEYGGDLGAEWLGLPPLWFHRGHHAQHLLKWGIIFGAVHVPLSLALGIYEDIKHRHHRHALEKTGLLTGLIAAGVAVGGFLGYLPERVATPTAVSLLLAAVIILYRAVGAMAAVHLLEIVSLIGNVLSYARLMALGIASVVLAEIANLLGQEAPHPLIGIPLAVCVHLINIGIGVFSPVLHSLRLNYVESLPKFYKPEGKYYVPFRKEVLS